MAQFIIILTTLLVPLLQRHEVAFVVLNTAECIDPACEEYRWTENDKGTFSVYRDAEPTFRFRNTGSFRADDADYRIAFRPERGSRVHHVNHAVNTEYGVVSVVVYVIDADTPALGTRNDGCGMMGDEC